MTNHERNKIQRGIEKIVYKDEITGREIWKLTNNDLMVDQKPYYDIDSWSPDGSKIVFSSAKINELDDFSGDPWGGMNYTNNGYIFIMDTDNYKINRVAEKAQYRTHAGAFPIWSRDGNKIYFRHNSGNFAVVDLLTGKINILEHEIRQISQKGNKAVIYNNKSDKYDGEGIYLFDLESLKVKLLVSKKEIYEKTPNNNQFSIENMQIGNTKWSPDDNQILLANWVFEKKSIARRSLYIIEVGEKNVRWLTHFGHHHSWTPDGNVLFVDKKRWAYIINNNGNNLKKIEAKNTKNSFPCHSHPKMDPTGELIVDWDEKGVFVLDTNNNSWQYVASFGNGFAMDHKGTHPHASWNLTGTKIIYNSSQFNKDARHSQLFIIPYEK